MGAVVLASMLVICVTFALLFRLSRELSGHALAAIATTVLAAAASTIHWLARPHLFTMLFLVIFLAVIARARANRASAWKTLRWLPLLTILWTNLHGGFLAGVLLLAAYGLGDIAGSVINPDLKPRAEQRRSGVLFLLVASGCLLASLVNPYGYQLHVHIWEYLRDPDMTRAIIEFKGTNFQDGASGYLEALLALGFGAALWYARCGRYSEVIVLAMWGHLALLVARNIPLFALVAAPLTAPAVASWLDALRAAPVAAWIRRGVGELQDISKELAAMEAFPRAYVVSALGLAVIAVGMAQPEPGPLWKAEYDPKSYPAAALKQLSPDLRVFTNDEWGDFLIYRLWPAGGKVYVDGRSDFYGSKFGREYIELINGRYDWEQTLDRYGVDAVLLPPGHGLASTIKESAHWGVVFDDGIAILFRRVTPAGAPKLFSTPTGVGAESGYQAALQKM
jgi:hypothetical protein